MIFFLEVKNRSWVGGESARCDMSHQIAMPGPGVGLVVNKHIRITHAILDRIPFFLSIFK